MPLPRTEGIVAGDRIPAPDATLIRALRNATNWAERIRAGTPLSSFARAEGVSERYMARIIHLDGLSPKIQAAIAQGRQPVDLTLKTLLGAVRQIRTGLRKDSDAVP